MGDVAVLLYVSGIGRWKEIGSSLKPTRRGELDPIQRMGRVKDTLEKYFLHKKEQSGTE